MIRQENRVRFSLDSTKDFEDRDLALRIVNTLLSLPPQLRPQKFDAFEPLKKSVRSPDEIVDLLTNRKGPKEGLRGGSLLLDLENAGGYSVQWNKSWRPRFSGIDGWIMSRVIGNGERILRDWIDGVRSFVEIVSPSYGEVRLMRPGGQVPRDLTLGLPEVPAISIYGKEYVDLFGTEKIEKAPFLEIEKVGECYWLVAQEPITEEVPTAIRAKIRTYFGEDAFVLDELSEHEPGRAPQFDFSNSLL